MLRFFRGIANSWFGPVILGSIVVAFGILGGGVRDVLRGRIENDVITAGSHTVSAAEFGKLFSARKEAYERQNETPFPLEDAVKQGGDKSMLDDLAGQTAYAEMLTRIGVRPTDDVIAGELKHQAESGSSQLSELFDSVTGKFKPELLPRFLQANGLTMQQFQKSLIDEIAGQQFGGAISGGFQAPRIFAAVQATLLMESRDVTFFVIPAGSIPKPAAPTDAQLNALIQQYRDQLMLPERRVITIVRFSAKALAPSMPVDPAAVQQLFEARKASYGKPELRSLVEIPLNDPKSAEQVQAALQRGEDPNAIAKSVGSSAVVYADQPQSAIADIKAGTAAFAMKAGDVSGPVLGDFKTVILKVVKVTPAQAPDLAAAKAQIEADLRQSEANDKALDLSQKFDDLVQGGASIQDAAAKVGATVVTVGPVTADGKDPMAGPQAAMNPVLSPKLLKTAFVTDQSAESDVTQDADKGEYYAVRVEKIIPPNPPGLDEAGVRPFLTGKYYQQTIVDALTKKGADAKARLEKGESFETVAAAFGGHVAHQLGLQRISAQQAQQAMGQDFVAQIFSVKAGQVFVAGSDPLQGFVVARVDATHSPDPAKVALLIDPVRQRASQPYLEGLAGAIKDAAVKWVKPTTDLDLARNAMGITPDIVARAAPKLVKGAPAS